MILGGPEEGSGGPLAGCTVLELAHALAGPHAGMLLGDLGARVIKVEKPGCGDATRGWGPPFAHGPQGSESTYFLSCNRNKESIELDIKDPHAKTTLRALVECADVVIENFRSDVLERVGLSHDQLRTWNSRLIILSISGFGHRGPDADRPGYDQVLQGESGLMSLTGASADVPTKVGVPLGDLLAGINGALGVVAALYERERTGVGQVVRTNLLESLMALHSYQGTRLTVAEELPTATGNMHPSICPYGMFRCQDGYVQIAVGSESLWHRFATAFGLDPDASGFTTNADRVRNSTHVIEVINGCFETYSVADVMAKLREAGVPAGVIKTMAQVYAGDQVAALGTILDIQHPSLGALRLTGSGIHLDRPRTRHASPPLLGQHTQSVLDELSKVHARGGSTQQTHQ